MIPAIANLRPAASALRTDDRGPGHDVARQDIELTASRRTLLRNRAVLEELGQ